jgi:hypothetical protein
MTRPIPEDCPPNVEPRRLYFAGGPVDTSSFVESHNGPTPTTLTPAYREPSRQERGLAFLKLAQINIAEALDTASAFERKFAIVASKTCIEQALELLK